jgi:hypothetical protein
MLMQPWNPGPIKYRSSLHEARPHRSGCGKTGFMALLGVYWPARGRLYTCFLHALSGQERLLGGRSVE